MSALVLEPARSGPLFGKAAADSRNEAIPRFADHDACGGEHVIDFALCLIIAAAVVGLLLLAL